LVVVSSRHRLLVVLVAKALPLAMVVSAARVAAALMGKVAVASMAKAVVAQMGKVVVASMARAAVA